MSQEEPPRSPHADQSPAANDGTSTTPPVPTPPITPPNQPCEVHDSPTPPPPITVAVLAADKGLPVDFLSGRDVWLRDVPDGVGIPYFGEKTSTMLGTKIRSSLIAKEGSKWPRGKPTAAYGLWRLAQAREQGFLVMVEGESDSWTLWYHGFPAFGIPGADNAKVIEAAHVAGFNRIYVFREPTPPEKAGTGGDAFINGVARKLKQLEWQGTALVVTIPGLKDPNDLHKRNPEKFREEFQRCLDAATPLPPPIEKVETAHQQHRGESRRPRLNDGQRPIDRVLARLGDHISSVGDTGRSWKCFCPAHDDVKDKSLSVGVTPEGKVLLHCFAGCPASAIVAAIDLTMADLFPEDGRDHDRFVFPSGICMCEPRSDDRPRPASPVEQAARRILDGAAARADKPLGLEQFDVPDPANTVLVPPRRPRPRKWPPLPVRDDRYFVCDPERERCRMPRGRTLRRYETGTVHGIWTSCDRRRCYGCGARLAREDKVQHRSCFKHAFAAGGAIYTIKTTLDALDAIKRRLSRHINKHGGGASAVRQFGGQVIVYTTVPTKGAEKFADLDAATKHMAERIDWLPMLPKRARPVTYMGQWRQPADDQRSGEFEDLGPLVKCKDEVARLLDRYEVPQVKPEIKCSLLDVIAWQDRADWTDEQKTAFYRDLYSSAPELVSDFVRSDDPSIRTNSDIPPSAGGPSPEILVGLERFDADFRPWWTSRT